MELGAGRSLLGGGGNLGEPVQSALADSLLRHPELTGACLDGTHGYCGCPAQARSIAFMEGQCTGLVLCPFTYCLEFPDVRVVLPGVPRVAVANFAEAGPHCLE